MSILIIVKFIAQKHRIGQEVFKITRLNAKSHQKVGKKNGLRKEQKKTKINE